MNRPNFDTNTAGASLDSVGRLTDEQRHAARRKLAAYALDDPDPAGWLAHMLSVLGLDGTVAPVGRCKHCHEPLSDRRSYTRAKGYCSSACLREAAGAT